MRALRLARLAAEAEGLVLRRSARRTVIRAMLGIAAAVFAVAALGALHVALFLALLPVFAGPAAPLWAVLCVAAADLALAAILGLLAAREASDKVREDAAALRDQALAELRRPSGLVPLLRPLLGVLLEEYLAWRRGRPKP